MTAEQIYFGRIKCFNHSKGIGFIETKEYGDVFLHYNSITEWNDKKNPEGMLVKFLVTETESGFIAKDVCLLPHNEQVCSPL